MYSIEKVDTHVHLEGYSPCSNFEVKELEQLVEEKNVSVTCITDHHTIDGALEYMSVHKTIIIPGVEVTTNSVGDVLVFSEDIEYLKSLAPTSTTGKILMPITLESLKSGDDTLIIWAHPLCNPVWLYDTKVYDRVLRKVDALELYNGTYSMAIFAGSVEAKHLVRMKELAKAYDVAMTGGSDSHMPTQFMRAYTEFPEPVRNVKDFIRQIKEHKVTPHFNL